MWITLWGWDSERYGWARRGRCKAGGTAGGTPGGCSEWGPPRAPRATPLWGPMPPTTHSPVSPSAPCRSQRDKMRGRELRIACRSDGGRDLKRVRRATSDRLLSLSRSWDSYELERDRLRAYGTLLTAFGGRGFILCTCRRRSRPGASVLPRLPAPPLT